MTTRDEVRNVWAGLVKAVAEKDAKALVDYYEADAIVPDTKHSNGARLFGPW
jgi:ketosteroid isomerase-like protein